jgi:acyl-CoA thioester hydrolase
MGEVFEKQFEVGWGNVDFNGHMANTSYMDFAATTRLSFFSSNGFPPSEFVQRQLGPVVKSEFVEYFREIKMLEGFRVDVRCSGMSIDGSRFRFVNCFYRTDENLAARITTTAGWLDLSERRLIAPPAELKELIDGLSKTEDFEVLDSSLRSR